MQYRDRSENLTVDIDVRVRSGFASIEARLPAINEEVWSQVANNLQNYTQSSTGVSFSVSYPLRRSFKRLGLSYSLDRSSLIAVSDASKLCVLHLIEHFQARGVAWLDVQTMTPHFEALGAVDISRDEFLDRVEEAQKSPVSLF